MLFLSVISDDFIHTSMSTHASSIAIFCLDDVHVILSVAFKGMALQFLSENKTKIFF